MLKELYKNYSAAKHTFAIFSTPHISIIALADCTTSAFVAFGVLMASVSVARVVFCEDIGQRIHHKLLLSNRALGSSQMMYDLSHISLHTYIFNLGKHFPQIFKTIFGRHANNFVKVFVKLKTNSTTTNSVSISAIITVIENFLISDVTRGFSQGENVAEKGNWQHYWRALAQTQKIT